MDERTAAAAERFRADIYATQTTGIVIEEAGENFARCSLEIDGRHMNANGQVMGGALFTLADFTAAVAANNGNALTVSLTSQIQFLNRVRGKKLFSVSRCVKSGRSVCVLEIEITDDTGTLVATAAVTGMRTQ